MKKGILLLNLGSPDSPAVPDVRRYLAQFLMDPYVIDIPWLFRFLVIYGFVLPKRPQETAKGYSQVWTAEGSPLLVYSRALQAALAPIVANDTTSLYLAMRYGQPAILDVLRQMREDGVTEIVTVPLYPHYAMSSTGTAIAECEKSLARLRWHPKVRTVAPFYAHPKYIEALVSRISKSLATAHWEHLLFSYHGLPERHLKKTDPTGVHCMRQSSCCQTPSAAHATCYRHQVFETTRLVAEAMGLRPDQYSVSFQSRLGRDKWLEPFTDPHVEMLSQRGIKHLAVVCPAFVADCLETIEEIGEVTCEKFLHMGGESFTLVPCMNADSEWVAALAEIVAEV
jgi:ferrochelatase